MRRRIRVVHGCLLLDGSDVEKGFLVVKAACTASSSCHGRFQRDAANCTEFRDSYQVSTQLDHNTLSFERLVSFVSVRQGEALTFRASRPFPSPFR